MLLLIQTNLDNATKQRLRKSEKNHALEQYTQWSRNSYQILLIEKLDLRHFHVTTVTWYLNGGYIGLDHKHTTRFRVLADDKFK